MSLSNINACYELCVFSNLKGEHIDTEVKDNVLFRNRRNPQGYKFMMSFMKHSEVTEWLILSCDAPKPGVYYGVYYVDEGFLKVYFAMDDDDKSIGTRELFVLLVRMAELYHKGEIDIIKMLDLMVSGLRLSSDAITSAIATQFQIGDAVKPMILLRFVSDVEVLQKFCSLMGREAFSESLLLVDETHNMTLMEAAAMEVTAMEAAMAAAMEVTAMEAAMAAAAMEAAMEASDGSDSDGSGPWSI